MKKILPIFALLFASIGVLVYVGVVYASVPVLRIAQLREGVYAGGEVRVDDGVVAAIESLAPLRFTVAPAKDPSARLAVESRRTVPENFKLGIDVSLVGEYDTGRGVFNAYRISTACPSKYEASKEGTYGGSPAYGAPPTSAVPGYVPSSEPSRGQPAAGRPVTGQTGAAAAVPRLGN